MVYMRMRAFSGARTPICTACDAHAHFYLRFNLFLTALRLLCSLTLGALA